jgi:hypothetical protein
MLFNYVRKCSDLVPTLPLIFTSLLSTFLFLLPTDDVGFLSDMSETPKIVMEVLRADGTIPLEDIPFFDQPLLREILMLNPASSMKTQFL